MLYQKVNFSSFQDAFNKAGRSNRYSTRGLEMLYEWLEESYNDGAYELDVIALCCQYDEYTCEGFLVAHQLEGTMTVEDLKQALKDDKIESVIAYDLAKDIILVDTDCHW